MGMMILDAQNDYQLGMSEMEASLRSMTEVQIGRDLPAHCEGAIAWMNQAASDFDAVEARNRRLMTSEGYAESMGQHRHQLRQELSTATGPLLDAIHDRIGALAKRLVVPPPKIVDRVALQQERRALLRPIDELVREQLFMESCRVGDELTWSAIEESAPYDSVRLRPEIIAEGRALRAQVAYPEVVTALRATEALRAAVRSAVRGFERHCGLIGDTVDLMQQDDDAET